MKHLIILSLLFSINAFGDWVKLSDFNSCEIVGYYDRHTCENTNQSECVKLPSDYKENCGLFQEELQSVTIDDLEKPIWGTRSMVESCASEEDCEIIHANKQCTDGRESYWSKDDLEVWCNKIVGYEQKYSHKVAVVDANKVAQKQAKQEAIRQIAEAKQYLSETDYLLLRELDGGEPMPSDVKTQRASKRALINSLEAEFGL